MLNKNGKLIRCCHCGNEAHTVSYRNVDGCTGKEVTCSECMRLPNEILSLLKRRFMEGDEYWSLITNVTPAVVLNSCWDDISEELLEDDACDHRYFSTSEDAVKYLNALGLEHIVIEDYRSL